MSSDRWEPRPGEQTLAAVLYRVARVEGWSFQETLRQWLARDSG